MRGLLGFLVTVQLIVGGVGAVTVGPDEEDVQTTALSSTTSSTAAEASPTTAARATPTAPKAAATTTTAAPPTLKPTPSGKYGYRRQSTAEGRTETTKGTWAYFTAQETDGELRQLMLDSDDHNDGLFWTRVSQAWRADGLYLRSFREDGSDGDNNECNFEPDLLLVPSPVVVGKKWTSTTACPGYDPPLRMESTSSVLRTDQASVGGKKVAVYVIETRARVPVEGAEGRLHTVAYFNVDLGFNVREETTYSSDVPGSGAEKEVYELLSLTPEPMDKATTTTSTTSTTTTTTSL